MNASIDSVSAACGIIVDPASESGFRHLGTAWQVAAGEWLTAWNHDAPPTGQCQLIHAHSGLIAPVLNWEQDLGLAGFRSEATEQILPIIPENETLHKRETLIAVGYPSVIAHPAFAIHRGSLNSERYHPYLCPWIIEGHLALYTKDHGWMAGNGYHGMIGGPVLNGQGKVVGLLSELSSNDPTIPPLSAFKRVSS